MPLSQGAGPTALRCELTGGGLHCGSASLFPHGCFTCLPSDPDCHPHPGRIDQQAFFLTRLSFCTGNSLGTGHEEMNALETAF